MTVLASTNVEASLLTVGQAARLLHVHPNTLRRWEAAGLLRARRLGPRRDRRFVRSEVERLLEAEEQQISFNGHGRQE